METYRTEPPASELNRPFITHQCSEQLTRPVFPQVSYNYRSAANTNYEYLHIYFLTILSLVPCLRNSWVKTVPKHRPSLKV